ncbi:MAG: D-2-hydroxyacid dehydrogenase [Candidatus Latescibacteria bacterium]|nr:D-2-hydroxyacid dehydrogenase [Candidatus Latescibacterota bacterium]
MSKRFVVLPPAGEQLTRWADRVRAAVSDLEVVVCTDRQQALDTLPQAQGAYGTMDAELLAAAPQLTWLACPAAGPPPAFYFPELVASDVAVTNTRGIYNDHICSHIMAFVLAFARGFHRYMPQQFQGKWAKGPDFGADIGRVVHLPDATALIIGTGGIGGATAQQCASFGMHVIGIDPRCPEPPPGVAELHRPEDLDQHLPRADFVIMTAPQTPKTQGLMNAGRLQLLKDTAFLINIGRGSNVKIDDLSDALYAGTIGGAALDVFEIEPLPQDHPLWKAPNFLLTPHVAGDGPYLEERRIELLVENCRRLAGGEELLNVVDKANWF